MAAENSCVTTPGVRIHTDSGAGQDVAMRVGVFAARIARPAVAGLRHLLLDYAIEFPRFIDDCKKAVTLS